MRVDAHIHLSNDKITEVVSRGKVSASFMYSVARFNAWVSICGFRTSEQMKDAKERFKNNNYVIVILINQGVGTIEKGK